MRQVVGFRISRASVQPVLAWGELRCRELTEYPGLRVGDLECKDNPLLDWVSQGFFINADDLQKGALQVICVSIVIWGKFRIMCSLLFPISLRKSLVEADG